MITKDIIAILAPDESVGQYEQAYIDTIEDPQLQNLMRTENEKVLSRDLQSQIPTGQDYEGIDDGSYDEEGLRYGTTIVDTGPSYTPQQAVAVQLLDGAGSTGR